MPLTELTQWQSNSVLGIIFYDGQHIQLINGVKFESEKMKSIRIKRDMTIVELKEEIQRKCQDDSLILQDIYYRRSYAAYGSVEYNAEMIATDRNLQDMLAIYDNYRLYGPIELNAKFITRIDLDRIHELTPWPGTTLCYIHYRFGVINALDGVKFVASVENPIEPLYVRNDITIEKLKNRITDKFSLHADLEIDKIMYRCPHFDGEGTLKWVLKYINTTFDLQNALGIHRSLHYHDYQCELCVRTSIVRQNETNQQWRQTRSRTVDEIMDLFRDPNSM